MDGVGFLISDNHSTDRTLEIIQDTVGSDDRFKISQQDKNLGSFENFKFVFRKYRVSVFLVARSA
ncbi:glycosyltransferase [Azotobacter vinelandii]